MLARMTSLSEDNKLPSRDFLGRACFWLHIAVLATIVAGWALPWRPALYFYLAFLPVMALHWALNANACVLNNLESLLRNGHWRDPANREEGQWLLTLVRGLTGLPFTPAQMDAISYGVLALLWGLGLWHLLGW
jgi:hypothetical protein